MRAVSFTATFSGTFIEADYKDAVANLVLVQPSQVLVEVSFTRRALSAGRKLQSGLISVATTILTPQLDLAADVAAAITTTSITNMAAGLSLTVSTVSTPLVTSFAVYPPPGPPTFIDQVSAGQAAATVAAAGGGLVAVVVVVVVVAILVIIGAAIIIRKHILNRGTSTIVKAVPVAAAGVADASATSASVESGGIELKESDESKI